MSKSTSKTKRKTSSGARTRTLAAHDRAVYMGFTMIGVFIVLLSIPISGGAYWRHTALAYLVFIAVLVNHAGWLAYAGLKMSAWRASLARLPLRCIGYGSKGGKPVEAAHDKREVRTMLLLSLVICLVVLSGLAVVFIPGLMG